MLWGTVSEELRVNRNEIQVREAEGRGGGQTNQVAAVRADILSVDLWVV